jgi:hypothetical protein
MTRREIAEGLLDALENAGPRVGGVVMSALVLELVSSLDEATKARAAKAIRGTRQ